MEPFDRSVDIPLWRGRLQDPRRQPSPRSTGWDRVSIMASGPIVRDRLGLVAGGSWTRGSQFERAESVAVVSDVAAAFGHLVFTPTSRDEIRTIGWLQQASSPFDLRLAFNQPAATVAETSGHVQSTWQHGGPDERPVKFFASYTRRHQSPAYDSTTGAVFERLVDGPVPAVANISRNSVHRWSVGGRIGGACQRRSALDATRCTRASKPTEAGFARRRSMQGDARELVDSLRARIWKFKSPEVASFRHEMGIAASVGDRVAITPRLTLDAAIRYDSVSGAAEGGAMPVSWQTLLPRAALRWAARQRMAARRSLRRTRDRAYRLPLDWLAYGDPAAPTANVHRWEGSSADPLEPAGLAGWARQRRRSGVCRHRSRSEASAGRRARARCRRAADRQSAPPPHRHDTARMEPRGRGEHRRRDL